MSNKKPEELSRNALLRLAVVAQDIQDEIHNSLTDSNKVNIQPDTINDYFRLITCEDEYAWDDDYVLAENDVRREQLRKIKTEGLDYLRSDEIIKVDYDSLGDDVFEFSTLTIVSDNIPYFPVEVNQGKFSSFYKALTKLSRPILEAELQQYYPYTQSDKQPTSHLQSRKLPTEPVKLIYKSKNNRLYNVDNPDDYMRVPAGQIRFLLDTLWQAPNHSSPSRDLWEKFKSKNRVRGGDDPIEEFKSSIDKFNSEVATRFLQEEVILRRYGRFSDAEENTISLNDDCFNYTDIK